MGNKRWIAMALAAALLPGTTKAVGASGSCPQPYKPWLVASTYPQQDPIPDLGQSVVVAAHPPDTDDDGVADQINSSNIKKLQITRGDGTINLVPGPGHSYVYLAGYSPQPGDLDGDGRDELVIGVDQQGVQFLLPGTTAPGTYAIADAGILLSGLSNTYELVGDQNGDHADDLAFPQGGGTVPQWETFSGHDLLAPGPGGEVTPPSPLGTYPGYDLVAADLGSNVPTIVTGVRSGNDSVIAVYQTPTVQLIATDFLGEYTGGVGQIRVSDRSGTQFVSLAATDRSGGEFAAWNFTDPCAGYHPPAPTAAPAPPAAPAAALPGGADYTG